MRKVQSIHSNGTSIYELSIDEFADSEGDVSLLSEHDFFTEDDDDVKTEEASFSERRVNAGSFLKAYEESPYCDTCDTFSLGEEETNALQDENSAFSFTENDDDMSSSTTFSRASSLTLDFLNNECLPFSPTSVAMREQMDIYRWIPTCACQGKPETLNTYTKDEHITSAYDTSSVGYFPEMPLDIDEVSLIEEADTVGTSFVFASSKTSEVEHKEGTVLQERKAQENSCEDHKETHEKQKSAYAVISGLLPVPGWSCLVDDDAVSIISDIASFLGNGEEASVVSDLAFDNSISSDFTDFAEQRGESDCWAEDMNDNLSREDQAYGGKQKARRIALPQSLTPLNIFSQENLVATVSNTSFGSSKAIPSLANPDLEVDDSRKFRKFIKVELDTPSSPGQNEICKTIDGNNIKLSPSKEKASLDFNVRVMELRLQQERILARLKEANQHLT